MIETIFIFVAYVLGTAFGYYYGVARGHKNGIVDCIDQLIEQGFLKYKGTKHNPEILKHDQEY